MKFWGRFWFSERRKGLSEFGFPNLSISCRICDLVKHLNDRAEKAPKQKTNLTFFFIFAKCANFGRKIKHNQNLYIFL